MANRWETITTVTDFIFLGSKITAYSAWSHEIKRCLLLGRKTMTNLDSMLKSIDITLPTKVHLVKAVVFPVVIYGCECWTIKAECWRLDAFEPWCWRRLLRFLDSPWTARRSNQSILMEMNPEYSLNGLMLKLKLQYFGRLMRRVASLEKSLMLRRLKAGGEENNRGWDDWMTLPTQWTWVWASSGRWWRTGKSGVLQSIGLQRVGHNWVTEQQQVSFWRAPSLWHAQLLGCVWLLATPRTIAQHAPPSMRFSRQEYWIGLPFLSPGDLPNPGIEPASPLSYDLVTPKSPAPNNLTLDAEFQFVNVGGCVHRHSGYNRVMGMKVRFVGQNTHHHYVGWRRSNYSTERVLIPEKTKRGCCAGKCDRCSGHLILCSYWCMIPFIWNV